MDVAAGNPSAMMGPAERARSLGLQSNGKGGYIDPGSGQVVAQTVNGELVFYSQNRATGGAVSDSSGGAALVSDTPSWADPVTGMVTTPPGKPEGPEELAAVPDSVPAKAPHGYNSFMVQQKQQMYMQADAERNMQGVPGDMEMGGDAPEQPIGDAGMVPGMGGLAGMQQEDKEIPTNPLDRIRAAGEARKGDYSPAGLAKANNVLGGVPMTAQMRSQNYRQTFTQQKAAQKQVNSIKNPAPQQEENPQNEIRTKLLQAITNARGGEGRKKGAGVNNLSEEDLNSFEKYVKEGPQNERIELSDEDYEWAKNEINKSLKADPNFKGAIGTYIRKLKNKGSPHADLITEDRGDRVLRSYLENLGQSAIDGSPLPMSESDLDHFLALAMGGTDTGENWRWLPTRFNNFKKDFEDNELLERIKKQRERDPLDADLKKKEQALRNLVRGDMRESFKSRGWEHVNRADLMEKKGAVGLQYMKALANAAGIPTTTTEGVKPGSRASNRSRTLAELRDEIIEKLEIPEKHDMEAWDTALFDTLQKLEDERSEVDSLNREKIKRNRDKKKAMKEEHSQYTLNFLDFIANARTALKCDTINN